MLLNTVFCIASSESVEHISPLSVSIFMANDITFYTASGMLQS